MQVSKYLYKHFAQLNWRTNKNGYIVFVGFVLFKKLITCKIAGYFFCLFLAKKNTPFCRGQNYYILKVICIGIK
jgi:hypothetical protein